MVVVNEKINSSFPMHFHTRCQNIKLVLKTKLETVIQCLYFRSKGVGKKGLANAMSRVFAYFSATML